MISCKGNVPQYLMATESVNDIFGSVSNPWDRSRTAGGSTGGEGALIATGEANSGLGSDIGGSLRIPALFCGICSLKPTAGRFDHEAESSEFQQQAYFGKTGESQEVILPTVGPLAKSVKDLILLSKVINEYNFVSLTLPPIAWRPVKAPARVGLLGDMSCFVEPYAASKRALQMSAEALQKANVEVVPIDLSDLYMDMLTLAYTAFFRDESFGRIMRGTT